MSRPLSEQGQTRVRNRVRLPASIVSLLVVEDDPGTRDVLVRLLRAVGVSRIWAVPSAEQALGLLEADSFSMILADYHLDGMDGLALVEQLRAQGNPTPVLLLSGAPDKAAVIRAFHHSRVDFFGKPFQIDQLLQAMGKLAAS